MVVVVVVGGVEGGGRDGMKRVEVMAMAVKEIGEGV